MFDMFRAMISSVQRWLMLNPAGGSNFSRLFCSGACFSILLLLISNGCIGIRTRMVAREVFGMPPYARLTEERVRSAALALFPVGTQKDKIIYYFKKCEISVAEDKATISRIVVSFDWGSLPWYNHSLWITFIFDSENRLSKVKVYHGIESF